MFMYSVKIVRAAIDVTELILCSLPIFGQKFVYIQRSPTHHITRRRD